MKICVSNHVQPDTTETLTPTLVNHVTPHVPLVKTLPNVLLVKTEPIYTMLNVSSHVQPDTMLMMPPTPVKFVTNIVLPVSDQPITNVFLVITPDS